MLPSAPRSLAVQRKRPWIEVSKYVSLSTSHLFVPIAIETLGPINEAGHSPLVWTGQASFDNIRRSQRVFLSFPAHFYSYTEIWRGRIRGTFDADTCHDKYPLQSGFNLVFLTLAIINTEGTIKKIIIMNQNHLTSFMGASHFCNMTLPFKVTLFWWEGAVSVTRWWKLVAFWQHCMQPTADENCRLAPGNCFWQSIQSFCKYYCNNYHK